jgi:hypothetical protein
LASTSTNKQPLLVDRPLHQWVSLGSVACVTDPDDYSSLSPGGCQLLVDCTGVDGAVIDSLSVVVNQATTTQVTALFYLSTAPTPFGITGDNTVLVASVDVGSALAGERSIASLPPLSVPVPHVGAMVNPSEADKKNTGIQIESNQLLYVGINTAITSPSPATRINAFAQGGYF